MNTDITKKRAFFSIKAKGRYRLPTRTFRPSGVANIELTKQQVGAIIDAIDAGKGIFFTYNKTDLLYLGASLKSDFKTVTIEADASIGLGVYAEKSVTPILVSPRIKRVIDRYEIINRINRIKAARRAKAALRKNVRCPKCGTEFSVETDVVNVEVAI